MFDDNQYLIRRKILKLIGADFHIYDQQQRVVGFSNMKGFKLKEDIRVYSDESKSQELWRISARNVIDFGGTYDIIDSASGQSLGAVRRKGFKSIIQDEWHILDTNDQQMGTITEDSIVFALIRRFLFKFLPQRYQGTIDGRDVLDLKQNFNPFVQKINLTFEEWPEAIDRRVAITAAIMMCAIEGKQD